ncbi:PRELI-like family-domain-containing protein [Radiomyces spectabilis]|uniref:PRELI-like family-domain-containing protein n=1 Tax=Radiomyces spectabilis TaxID=64574 RepID=UPI00222123D1|nr:PRELI-like family-domain-containing protein [Radiomyces spectabilis]KAI8388524.1 PRELI-like family-domain-containing protein [Radiomyces spectabilis]
MVKFYQHTFNYEYPWQTVSYAFWLRYPNPFASHVLAVDVLDRYVDEKGVLKTTRLVLKKGKVPKWFPESFLKNSEAFIIEESEVDPKSMTMTTRTKNLNHVRIMQVEETQTFRPNEQNPAFTSCKTEARIISRFGWGMTNRIEAFGQGSFASNAAKARKGMHHILQTIREKQMGGRVPFLAPAYQS